MGALTKDMPKFQHIFTGCKEFPDVSDVVSKVRFFIHQTYAPNNVIDVAHPPYHLIRRGWGEFPARVQIHFRGSTVANKPVDVMHFIKVFLYINFAYSYNSAGFLAWY